MVKICKYGGAPENSMDTSRDYATLFGDTVYVTEEYFVEELDIGLNPNNICCL